MSDLLRDAMFAGQFAHDTEIIRSEYPEVLADPRLAWMAHQTVHDLWARDMAAGRLRPGIDLYREAGNSVLDLVGKRRGRSGDDDLAARQQAAADAAAQRNHDIISEMRRGRGQSA